MVRKKKLIALILAETLAVTMFAGCSNPASQSSQSPSAASVPSSTTQAPSSTTQDNPSSAEPVLPSSAAEEVDAAQSTGDKTLVVYFSASGNTRAVAQTAAETLGADIYELVPEQPYSDADLNWTDSGSRVNTEHNDPAHRTAIAGGTKDLSEYSNILIGYPLWWREAPSIVWNFVENSNLAGKTLIPFCTSTSNGIGTSGDTLAAMASNATWLPGQRFGESLDAAAVTEWVNSLGLNNPTELTDTAAQSAQSGSLVVYFSMPETTDPNNMTQDEEQSTVIINGEVLGNTQYMAYVIQEATGAEIFRIEPETPYPTDHETLVNLASSEQSSNARPAISGSVDLSGYDTIYLGYPNWWGDMPMIIYSFLDSYDLSGKTIVPFNTHGGSGFSSTIGAIREMEPAATVLDGLSISRNSIQDARQEIISWVNGLSINR